MLIPNNIILTWKDHNIPDYVIPNIQKLNPDKNILFFTDQDIVNFLKKEYDSSYIDFFHNLKLGCSKGDFFRYCYLFKYGGYYCDIDILHKISISKYITDDIEFFSIISALTYISNEPSIFQALLFCCPNHDIINNCIKDIMSYRASTHKFLYTTEDMYSNISNYLNIDNLIPQKYTTTSGNILSLGIEKITREGYICDYNNSIIALSRYPNYTREKGFI